MKTVPFQSKIKVLLLGESGVGKSSILYRFTEGRFPESSISTIGVDFQAKDVQIGDLVTRL
jgi:GTPase SAR1 family protein